jgi:VanZ family protein
MKPLSSKQNFVTLWFPAILWSAFIFFWSSIPDLKIQIFVGIINFVIRKILHITEFAILSFLYYRAVNNNSLPKKFSQHFFPVILSFLFAISDEIHQYFVPGRGCSAKDVIIDTVGIFFGSLGYLYSKYKIYKIKKFQQ